MTLLGYDLHGPADAPTLVLGPSLGTTIRMWQRQLDAFAERYQVLRFDLRGHGRSAAPPGPYRLEDLGRDVLALLDRLGIRRIRYAGVSLGGMIGMWLAANAPQRVERLGLVCTSAHMPPASGWLDRAARARAAGTASLAGTVPLRWFTAGFREREPQTYADFAAMLADQPSEGYAGCCEAIAAMDLRPELPRIIAPTLIIAGADDEAAPPSHAETIAAGVEGARLAVVDDAAHLANVEQPGTVGALLLDHMDGGHE